MDSFATMVTPYRADGSVDLDAAECIVQWYYDNGLTGVFAVCQSSEIFFLTVEEREALAQRVYRKAKSLERSGGRRFTVVSSGYGRRSPESAYTVHNLGTSGSTNYKLKKGESVAAVISVTPDEDLLIATKNGKMLRTPSEQISSVNRTGRGVRVLNLEGDDEIISVTAIPKETADDDEQD